MTCREVHGPLAVRMVKGLLPNVVPALRELAAETERFAAAVVRLADARDRVEGAIGAVG